MRGYEKGKTLSMPSPDRDGLGRDAFSISTMVGQSSDAHLVLHGELAWVYPALERYAYYWEFHSFNSVSFIKTQTGDHIHLEGGFIPSVIRSIIGSHSEGHLEFIQGEFHPGRH